MKFSIEKNVILNALTNVSRALSQKTTIPVLSGIKFELDKSNLTLLASDSELTIKVTIEEKDIKHIEKTGESIFQSKNLLDIIRKMPSDVVHFESTDTNVKIYSDTNEFNLNCYNINDYPNFKLDTNDKNLRIKSNDFKNILNLTTYAMSTQELRPLLTGLNFVVVNNTLECIATDSYRLAKKVTTVNSNLGEEVNIVIPGRTVMEINKIIEDNEDDIVVNIFSNKILFIYNNITIQSNLLSGSYPQTSQFIPDDFKYMINLNLNNFYDAIDRAALLASNKDRNIIRLEIREKEMLITSSMTELGKTEEKIEIDTNKVDKLEFSISSKYLLDALKVINDDNILLLLNSDDSPVIIKAVNDEDFTELILPMKSY